ncbi:MAG: tetratricopeptide repeat protein [Pseudomonadales bacterium]|nr:tetratricopeptide repeat protein [Pseudomonadales bacterium]
MVSYSTRNVAEFIGLSPDRVRRYVHRGVLEPERNIRGHFNFEFQDVVLMRTAKRLLDAKVSPKKTLKLLVKIKSNIEVAQKLASVRIYACGQSVLVRNRKALWNADTGQGILDFDNRPVQFALTSLHGPDLMELLEGEELDTDDWYNLGLDLEEMDGERAPIAYARAIELDADNLDAHVNLGRLEQIQGNLEMARQRYMRALTLNKEHQLANYNMGTLCDEVNQLDAAQAYYLKASEVPDAHFNLARIFELRGDEVTSFRHLRHYKRLLEVT